MNTYHCAVRHRQVVVAAVDYKWWDTDTLTLDAGATIAVRALLYMKGHPLFTHGGIDVRHSRA
jgi:hypothetical protein